MRHNEELYLRNIPEIKEIIGENPPFFAVLNTIEYVCNYHQKLGEEGKKKDVINQFGEQALRADIAAETTVIEELKEYIDRNNITIEMQGEETGTTILGKNGEKYFGTLDGLDGSSNYLTASDWSYGTMLTIAKGDDPKYSDFEIAAIGFPEENWVLLAVKGHGVHIFDIDKRELNKLKSFEDCDYDQTKILSDNHFPEAKVILGKMQEIWPRTGSQAASILAIASGSQIANPKYPKMNEGWQGLVDVTRKGNIEQPALYLILSELNGVVVDKNCQDIGNYNFKNWGQKEKTPIISARSIDIAKKILTELLLKG